MRSVSEIDKQNRNAFSFFKHIRWLKEVWNLVGKCKFFSLYLVEFFLSYSFSQGS